MRVTWKKRAEISESRAIEISQELAVPQKIVEVLLGRGIEDVADIQECFSPKLKTLRDPLTIRDMKKAVERIELALDRGERICVYADYDLDGSSGLALLYEGLKKFGFDGVTYYQPKRLSEGYGVHPHAIEQLASEGVGLVITVDVGITAFDALARAKELNVDVIVTDHHLPFDKLPEAFAIVNPNCSDCTSGLGHLSGAGVAFYLVLAIKRHFSEKAKLKKDFDPKTLLDFFTIGTLTDMVPLIGENRALVHHGLAQLTKTTRPGLRQLLIELNLDGRDLTSQDVAIMFAPKLNALSRMEIGLLPVDIFFVDNEDAAREMISTVTTNNKKRKDLQAFAEAWACDQVLHQVSKGFALVTSEQFHKGVIGLVATRLTQKFGVPAFVGSLSKDGEVVGSARAPERSGINLVEVFEACREHLKRFGGHAKAAGFALDYSKLEDFEKSLTDYFKNPVSPEIRMEYDAELSMEEITDKFLKYQGFMEPFGQSFPQPRFRIQSRLLSEKTMNGGHKRLILESGRELVYFSPPETLELKPGPFEALVRVQKNYFRQRESLQILVDDARCF